LTEFYKKENVDQTLSHFW